MSYFRKEIGIIPKFAWFLAIVVYLTSATLIFCLAMMRDPSFRNWPLAGKILFPYGLMILPLMLILLIGYVNADAKRRGMRYVMWTILAALIPDCIGIILYFLLRDPMPAACRKCGAMVSSKFTFCPSCGAPARPTCPHCGKATEYGWTNCAFCGGKLPTAA